jgi:hypothetical protein
MDMVSSEADDAVLEIRRLRLEVKYVDGSLCEGLGGLVAKDGIEPPTQGFSVFGLADVEVN